MGFLHDHAIYYSHLPNVHVARCAKGMPLQSSLVDAPLADKVGELGREGSCSSWMQVGVRLPTPSWPGKRNKGAAGQLSMSCQESSTRSLDKPS